MSSRTLAARGMQRLQAATSCLTNAKCVPLRLGSSRGQQALPLTHAAGCRRQMQRQPAALGSNDTGSTPTKMTDIDDLLKKYGGPGTGSGLLSGV